MMKKTIFFMLCLAPIGAQAIVVDGSSSGALSAGYDAEDAAINVNNMIIGQAVPQTPDENNFYAGLNISPNFTVKSDVGITISKDLTIAAGKFLGLAASSESATESPIFIDISVNGNINAGGELVVNNANAFTVGGKASMGNGLTVTAKSMTAGDVDVTGGVTDLNISGDLTMNSFANSSSDISYEENGIAVAVDGVDIDAENIDITTNLVSTGGNMDLAATGDITIGGYVTNTSTGTMSLHANNLTINGGMATGGTDTPSFVNSGNLVIDVQNATSLAHGFDLSNMGTDNTFSLTTGTLDLGDSANTDRWLNVFSNKLDSFRLNIKQGGLDIASSVINGLINEDAAQPSYNTDANMDIAATEITVGSDSPTAGVSYDVENHGGTLTLVATNSQGAGIEILGDVYAAAGTTATNIDSAASLNINGDVSNLGQNMSLSADGSLVIGTDAPGAEGGSVTNSNGVMDILASTHDGKIHIYGDVTNESGELNINAKDIAIDGTLISKGDITNDVITIDGSDSVDGESLKVGAIDASLGGRIDIDALVGVIDVDGMVTVNNGAMTIGSATHAMNAGGSITIGGNLVAGDAVANAGDVVVNASGNQGFSMVADNSATNSGENNAALNIYGNIVNTQLDGNAHNLTLGAGVITIGSKDEKVSVDVAGAQNSLVFGTSTEQQLTVWGDVSAQNGAKLEIAADDANVGSLDVDASSALFARGTQITATDGDINIGGGLWFDGAAQQPGVGQTTATGMIVSGTDAVAGVPGYDDPDSMALVADTGNIVIGGAIDLGAKQLDLTADNGDVNVGAVTSSGNLNMTAQNVVAGGIDANAGVVDIAAAEKLTVDGAIDIANGAVVKIDANRATDSGDVANVTAGDVSVNGNVVQGETQESVALNLLAEETNFAANSLSVTGDYIANAGTVAEWVVENAANISGTITIADGASLVLNAGNATEPESAYISANALDNSGVLQLISANGIDLHTFTNTGDLTLDSGAGVTTVDTFAIGADGKYTLAGAGLTTDGVFSTDSVLFQNLANAADKLQSGQVNIDSDDYTITASQFEVNGVDQTSGKLVVNASDVTVNGNIDAVDLRFAKNPENMWIDATVNGSVSGGVDFWGIRNLDIIGENSNYIFNNKSDLWAAVLPYNAVASNNASSKNYWSTVESTSDNSVGKITNAENGQALISVSGQFISEMSGVYNQTNPDQPEVGITLFQTVDQGTAIWLLHAEGGIQVADEFDKLRNLEVKFCNADGSKCLDYASTLNPGGKDPDLPIYITERDTDGDGLADSLYVVFDPAFGGPVDVFKLQPIVESVASHTTGEYVSAGALDDLIAGQLLNDLFDPKSPIEVIPVMFKGSNFETMANELYDRMDYYSMTGEREPLARFSRLFQARELEQIAGAISLNEHTTFRDFEDRMFDEFIWNRNRSLKKAWLDVDYGLFSQDVSDGKRVKGDRFSIAGGFDWQESETMILGVTAHISNSSSDNSDVVDLSYLPQQRVIGTVDMTVDDLNIGFGGYLMKTLGEKTRLYGNAFLDVHMLDISRDQTFMDHIDGDGTAFSLISEWGLMHDWLNQYIVGNAYARVGYNFGFDVTEHAGGQDYMDMQSDGYLILTPGYSLIAQKRIYPSAWFQIRPYASIGVEYDVLGAPDFVKYKFAPAHTYTKYDIDIDPLWANIGGGVELLSASGLQFGIDYRYQYNDAIQLHNIKVTGSYRF